SFGAFVALLPAYEQQPLYNAFNFDVNGFETDNSTVHSTGIATHWCPSDPSVSQSQMIADWVDGPKTLAFTSYAGSQGPWWVWGQPVPSAAALNQNVGLFHQESTVKFAQITDGLSQTIGFGERAHGLINPSEAIW